MAGFERESDLVRLIYTLEVDLLDGSSPLSYIHEAFH